MSSQFLPVFHDNAVQTLFECLPMVDNQQVPLSELNMFCQQYRIKGICSLLMTMDLDGLRQDLYRSGRCFLYGLNKLPKDKRTISKLNPFFDAIACYDFAGAKQITELARKTPNLNVEYEEDFLYFYFLMQMFFLNGEQSELEKILSDYQALNEGEPRFAICKALYEKNDSDFQKAMEALIIDYEKKFQLLAERGIIPEEELATEGQIFIEGWVLLIMAEKRGLISMINYRYIPSVLQQMSTKSLEHVDWRTPV